MLTELTVPKLLRSLETIQNGSLRLTAPNGHVYDFAGKNEGPSASIVIHDWHAVSAFFLRGNVGFAETYRDGLWDTNDLESLVRFGIENRSRLSPVFLGSFLGRITDAVTYLMRANSREGSRRNIPAHYDLGNDFYGLWLDPGMTYSSALFSGDADTLAAAQTRKYDRILDTMRGRSGDLLEIGCGWGGFAERAMGTGDYAIKGLTLSHAQHDYAQNRLGGNARIALEDYRDQDGQYDHIVSIEMFEAVGERYWNTYFEQVARLLKKGGSAMIQTITIREDMFKTYKHGVDFIRSYIFPGGMLPSLERFKAAATQAGLAVHDVFGFGQDYAQTLRHWQTRFDAHEDQVRAMGFPVEFTRMWRLYLAGCAAGFASGDTDVVQVKLAHAA